MRNLIQDIKTREFKNIYLLMGEEDYLKRQYKHELQRALLPEDDTVNLNCYEGRNISVQELIDQGETLPFFAERRLLVVEDSGFFKGAAPQLAEYLEHVPPTTYFLFVESEVDKRQKLYKTVKSRGRVVEFSRQGRETLVRWVYGKIKKENKNITRRAMDLFLEKTGDDLNVISRELEKLLSYTMDRDAIDQEEVEAICTTQTVNRVFGMIDAMAAGNTKQVFALYRDLLALKEPPMRILYLITRQFNQLLQVRELRSHGYDVESIAARLGMQRFVAQRCVGQSERFTERELRSRVELCIATEEDIKTGRLNERLGVELLLVQK